MPELGTLRTLALIFGSALLAGVAARRLRQPVILGYVATGFVIGPFGLKLLGDVQLLQDFAGIGVALLMFAIGLEFSLRELQPVRRVAIVGSHLQMALTILLGFVLGMSLGWPWRTAVVLGCIIAISSTMVVLSTLNERGELSSIAGRVTIGVLIIQDLAVVPMTTVFPLLGRHDLLQMPGSLVLLLAKATILIFGCIAVGRWVIPLVLREVSRLHSKELFMLTAVALALGTAYLTHRVGLTLSLGAFLAGLVIGNSRYCHAVLAEVSPLRDAFVILFFVSIGTLLSPAVLGAHAVRFFILLGGLIFGKFVIGSATTLLFGYPGRVAVAVGLSLVPIGEFSFVLAQVARDLGLITGEVYALALALAVVSTALTPAFLSLATPCYEWLERLRFLPRLTYLVASRYDRMPEEMLEGHVILCGYGRVGGHIGRALRDFGKQVVVIDADPYRVEEAHRDRLPSLYGDASKRALLRKAGVKRAALLVVALEDPVAAGLILEDARREHPELPAVVRFRDPLDLEGMAREPSVYPVLAEFEGALRMVRQTLLLVGVEPREYLVELARQVYQESSPPDHL